MALSPFKTDGFIIRGISAIVKSIFPKWSGIDFAAGAIRVQRQAQRLDVIISAGSTLPVQRSSL